MNSIAAFQIARALDEERLRRAEKRRLSSEAVANPRASDGMIASMNWRAVLRFPRYSPAASKG